MDHFIPRVRCGIDAVQNLVLADRVCNGDKGDLLPAPIFVGKWADRNLRLSDSLSTIAELSDIDSDPVGTHGGGSIDLQPPPGSGGTFLAGPQTGHFV